MGVDKDSIQGLASISDEELVKYVLKNSKVTKKIMAVLLPIIILLAAAGVWIFSNGLKPDNLNIAAGVSDSKEFFNLITPQDNYVRYDKKLYEKSPPSTVNANDQLAGRLFVDSKPWADVYIDGKKIDTTPLSNYIQLKPGKYYLKLVHPNYPPFTKRITINNENIETVKIDFDDKVGFLDCKINPWGNVYIDGELKGTTPFREPVILFPGTHELKITNPQYGDYEQKIKITAKETYPFKLNFDETNKVVPDTTVD